MFIGTVAALLLVLAGLAWQGQRAVGAERRGRRADKVQLVRTLQLTDLSLWTEARYTRHPSQTDVFSPFQDFPSALEHFPAGSLLAPPRRR